MFLTFGILECSNEDNKNEFQYGNPQKIIIFHFTPNDVADYEIIIDSCEYIVWHYNSLTHKGNCKYCKLRNEKPQK